MLLTEKLKNHAGINKMEYAKKEKNVITIIKSASITNKKDVNMQKNAGTSIFLKLEEMKHRMQKIYKNTYTITETTLNIKTNINQIAITTQIYKTIKMKE